MITRSELERANLFGEKLYIRCVGILIFDDHIPADLASETIASVSVVGFLSASQRFFEAVDDRIQAGIRLTS
jgi:hypothetical protein